MKFRVGVILAAALLGFSSQVGASTHYRLVSPAIMAKTWKVHKCEWSLNWRGNSTYPDGIGMTRANYEQFRNPSFPVAPQDNTPEQQAWDLAHFLGHYHMAWPHQTYPAYCGPGY